MENSNYEFDFDDPVDLTNVIQQQLADSTGKQSPGDPNPKQASNRSDGSQKKSSQEVINDSDYLEKFVDGVRKGGAPDDVTKWYLTNKEEDDSETDDDLEGSDQKGDKEFPTPNKIKDGEKEDELFDEDSYKYPTDVLDILREEGLLYIPDDFDGELTADVLDELKGQTRQIMQQEIIDSVRQRYANDPYTLQVFDYMVFGESHVNLPHYQNVVQSIQNLESLDLRNEEVRKSLLKSFLSDGLNSENPGHKLLLNKVDAEVDQILASYDVENRLKEAKSYFMSKFMAEKQQEEQRVALEKYNEQQELAKEQLRLEKWHNDFYNTLQQKQWSIDKKRAVYDEHYQEVQFQDGSTVPMYYAKEMMIKSNPELYQVYLDWLHSNFDLKTGTFKNQQQVDDKTKVTRKILELAKKKESSAKKSFDNFNNNSRNNTSERMYINPLDNI